MPLLRIERNGKVLSIKKANRKEEEKRDESNVLGPATNSTQSHQSNRNCNFCAILHTVRATPLYRNNSMPSQKLPADLLPRRRLIGYRGWMCQNKISSAIQHTRSGISCGACSHTQKTTSDNTHDMINRQDATLSTAHPSSETM